MRKLLLGLLGLCIIFSTNNTYTGHGRGGAALGGFAAGSIFGGILGSAASRRRHREPEVVYVQQQPAQDPYVHQRMHDQQREIENLKAQLAHTQEATRLAELRRQKEALEDQLENLRRSNRAADVTART